METGLFPHTTSSGQILSSHRQCQLSVSDVRWDSLTSYGLSKLTPSVLRWIGGIKTDDRGMLYLDRNILIALWERYHHFYSSVEAACPQLRPSIGGSAVRNPRRDKWHKFENKGNPTTKRWSKFLSDVEKLGKVPFEHLSCEYPEFCPHPNADPHRFETSLSQVLYCFHSTYTFCIHLCLPRFPFPFRTPSRVTPPGWNCELFYLQPPGQLYWGPIEKTEADFPQKFQPKKLLKLEGEDYVRLAAIHTVTKERLRRLELSEMENWRKETEKAREKETMKDYMERVENRVHLVGKLLIELPLIQTRCRMETSSEPSDHLHDTSTCPRRPNGRPGLDSYPGAAVQDRGTLRLPCAARPDRVQDTAGRVLALLGRRPRPALKTGGRMAVRAARCPPSSSSSSRPRLRRPAAVLPPRPPQRAQGVPMDALGSAIRTPAPRFKTVAPVSSRAPARPNRVQDVAGRVPRPTSAIARAPRSKRAAVRPSALLLLLALDFALLPPSHVPDNLNTSRASQWTPWALGFTSRRRSSSQ
ncbi:uncharacterized protein BXZ73DRAFT_98785 [Epithele typhae]|uniref:uncharacterized protein n=1 Tax=Epithele typhae TaxID=378194 RepID=UPI0020081AE7|nr:uncharacterized protein BXZ73DRAFT_98785 [Epithele typhae]KAH9940345.1 hypothetical protein BXZ73DRAFT_98785 [Epithele typhae]